MSVYHRVLKFRIERRYVGCRGYVSSMQLSFLSFTFIEKVLTTSGPNSRRREVVIDTAGI